MTEKEHDFKLLYDFQIEVGHFTTQGIRDANKGGTDALIVINCLEMEDGSYVQEFVSKDGNNAGAPLTTGVLFKAWSCFGAALLDYKDLSAKQREVIENHLSLMRVTLKQE